MFVDLKVSLSMMSNVNKIVSLFFNNNLHFSLRPIANDSIHCFQVQGKAQLKIFMKDNHLTKFQQYYLMIN